MKKHGYYCKVCGEYKANEKFSGKGHAAHICKKFFRITVPMMASGIISGAILSWVTMISELSTAIILYTGKTKTLTVAIYTEVIRGNYGTAAALSTIMTILTVISLLAFSKLNGGKDISL